MNCDGLARWYRWVEWAAFGRTLERSRFRFLDRLSDARNVLLLGEGDGRTLARLLRDAPHAKMDVFELSGEMITLARRRAGGTGRVRFWHEDGREAALPGQHYDGVVTAFFLDCFEEAEARRVIGKVKQALAPGAVWIVAEFGIPESGWRRWHACVWVRTMYWFFGVTTGLRVRQLAPVSDLMRQTGMLRLESAQWRWGLVRAEVWMNGQGPL